MENNDYHIFVTENFFGNKQLYLNLFENSGDAIVFIAHAKVVDCNVSARNLFGFSTKSEVLGLDIFDFSPEEQDNGQKSNQEIKNKLSSSMPKFDWKFRTTRGTTFVAQVLVNSFEHQHYKFLQLTIRALPPRESAKGEMGLTENILNTIIETIPQPLYIKNDQFRYINCNQAFCDYFGKTRSEIIGATISDIIDEERAKRHQNNDIELLRSGISQTYESKIILNEDREHDVVFHKNIVVDGHGDKLGIVGIIEDITENKRDKAELIESELKYKKIFENVQDIFYRTDLNGILTEISPSIQRYSRYIHSDIIGQPIDRFYVDPSVRKLLLQEIQNKGEAHDFEILLKGINNQHVWSSVNAHFTYDKAGNVTGVEGIVRDLTERKQAEQKLKQSLALLQATLDATTNGILVVDFSGKITSYNKQFKQIFGISDEILELRDDATAIECVLDQLKYPEEFVSRIQYLYNNPELASIDTIELKDGRILERFSGQYLLDEKPIGRVWSFTDITERKQVEQALQDKEAHLSALIQTIPDLIWVKDINGVYLTCNKRFENFWGVEASDIIGNTDYDFVDRELADFFRQHDKNAIKVGRPISNEEWVTHARDGSRVLFETIKTPMFDPTGTIIGVLGIARDITARKMAEEKLRESEEKYRNLIETMPDGVYRSTAEGKFIEVNAAMVKILGYDSKEDLMAIDIKNELYFNPEDRENLTLEFNNENLNIYPLKKKDGTAVWIEEHGWFVKDENGKIVFHEGVSRDITGRRMAETQLKKYSEELKELNATKDKYFSIIAHDLKNPFHSIIGLSDVIKNEAKYLDIATIEQYAGSINTISKSTFRLLENLLDWARVQQSKMPFRPVSLILRNVVNDVTELMVEKANSKMIAIINYIPDNLIIVADKNMLGTIFRNLLSNALKFTPVYGKIEIMATLRENRYEISVKDSGVGIKKENLDRIFEIGSGFSTRGTENEKGTGLGLLLCKEFVESHHGKIWVESEEGNGSTFTFSINQDEFATQ